MPMRRVDRLSNRITLLLVGLLLLSWMAIGIDLVQSRRIDEKLALTYERQAALSQLIEGLVDAETAQRGYIITGNKDFLLPYQSGRKSAMGALARMRDVNDINMPKFAAEVKPGVDERISMIENSLKLYGEGHQQDAIAQMRKGRGREMMDQLRGDIALERLWQQTEIQTARRQDMRARRILEGLMAVSGLIMLASTLGIVRMMRRHASLLRAEIQAERLQRENVRSELLVGELNHRVKNLFTIVAAIITASGRGETDVPTAMSKARERVLSLGRVHALTAQTTQARQMKMGALVHAVLDSLTDRVGQIEIDGPDVGLNENQVSALGMVLHELATNARKYGALGQDGGRLDVSWSRSADDVIRFDWRETLPGVVQPRTSHEGFGSQMIEMSLAQIGATMARDWTDHGLHLSIDIPPQAGDNDA